jgi:hypothetical protein
LPRYYVVLVPGKQTLEMYENDTDPYGRGEPITPAAFYSLSEYR